MRQVRYMFTGRPQRPRSRTNARKYALLLALCGATLPAFAPGSAASRMAAKTFTVNSTADTNACTAASCTLARRDPGCERERRQGHDRLPVRGPHDDQPRSSVAGHQRPDRSRRQRGQRMRGHADGHARRHQHFKRSWPDGDLDGGDDLRPRRPVLPDRGQPPGGRRHHGRRQLDPGETRASVSRSAPPATRSAGRSPQRGTRSPRT